MAVTLCLSCSLGLLNWRPRGSLCWVMAFFIASYQHLLWTPNSIGVPEGPLGRVWLSLPHLLSNWPGTPTQLARRTQLNYIIIRRPLDLWNRMFNRHQAEITVMQFRGHSLPVHQSMSVPWEFLSSSHFISKFPPTRFPHITAIGMCHFLPVHHLEWHFARAEGQNITRRWSLMTEQYSWLSIIRRLDIGKGWIAIKRFIFIYKGVDLAVQVQVSLNKTERVSMKSTPTKFEETPMKGTFSRCAQETEQNEKIVIKLAPSVFSVCYRNWRVKRIVFYKTRIYRSTWPLL